MSIFPSIQLAGMRKQWDNVRQTPPIDFAT